MNNEIKKHSNLVEKYIVKNSDQINEEYRHLGIEDSQSQEDAINLALNVQIRIKPIEIEGDEDEYEGNIAIRMSNGDIIHYKYERDADNISPNREFLSINGKEIDVNILGTEAEQREGKWNVIRDAYIAFKINQDYEE